MTVGETRTLSFKVHKHTWLTTVPLFLCYINPKIFSSSRLLSISLWANFQKGYSDQMHRSIIDECCKKCLIACHFHANVLMQCVNKLTWMVSLKASRRKRISKRNNKSASYKMNWNRRWMWEGTWWINCKIKQDRLGLWWGSDLFCLRKSMNKNSAIN